MAQITLSVCTTTVLIIHSLLTNQPMKSIHINTLPLYHILPASTRYLLLMLLLLGISISLKGQQANVNLDHNPHRDSEGLTPFSAPLNSPEVHGDRTVIFRLKAPHAGEVLLPPGAIHTALGKG